MLHHMQLHARPFEEMKSGRKRSELRLNDEKRQLIKVGDTIEFISRENPLEKIVTEVIYLKTYPTFVGLFHGVREDYPDWEEEGFIQGMYEYYSPEDEQKYGAIEIGVQLLRLPA